MKTSLMESLNKKLIYGIFLLFRVQVDIVLLDQIVVKFYYWKLN